jgi:hypothetical protein
MWLPGSCYLLFHSGFVDLDAIGLYEGEPEEAEHDDFQNQHDSQVASKPAAPGVVRFLCLGVVSHAGLVGCRRARSCGGQAPNGLSGAIARGGK